MRVSGERVVVSGPTGREPLVGLRVALQKQIGRTIGLFRAAKLRKANRKISCSDGRARRLRPLNTGPGEFVRPRSRFPQPA